MTISSKEWYRIREGVQMRFVNFKDGHPALISIIEAKYHKGNEVPNHFHKNEDEVFYVLEGVVNFRLEHKEFIKSQGESIFLEKNKSHGFSLISDTAKLLILYIPGGLESFFIDNILNRDDAKSLEDYGVIFTS